MAEVVKTKSKARDIISYDYGNLNMSNAEYIVKVLLKMIFPNHTFQKLHPTWCVSPKTGAIMEIDLGEEDNLRLGVEYNGFQHYVNINNKYTRNIKINNTIENDGYKKIKCIENKFTLICIPYIINWANIPKVKQYLYDELIKNNFKVDPSFLTMKIPFDNIKMEVLDNREAKLYDQLTKIISMGDPLKSKRESRNNAQCVQTSANTSEYWPVLGIEEEIDIDPSEFYYRDENGELQEKVGDVGEIESGEVDEIETVKKEIDNKICDMTMIEDMRYNKNTCCARSASDTAILSEDYIKYLDYLKRSSDIVGSDIAKINTAENGNNEKLDDDLPEDILNIAPYEIITEAKEKTREELIAHIESLAIRNSIIKTENGIFARENKKLLNVIKILNADRQRMISKLNDLLEYLRHSGKAMIEISQILESE